MQLKPVRPVFDGKSTYGKLYLNAYTYEDTVRHMNGDCSKKIKNETAIDPGVYEVALTFSNRFQKYLPLLLNVKCFDGIRMHGGNTAEDSEGCIFAGAEGDIKTKIWNCASNVAGLVAAMKAVEKTEKISIDITEE